MATLKLRQHIANEYGTTVRTLNHWIHKRKLPIEPYLALTLKDIKLIYDSFGYPQCVKKADYEHI